MRICVYENLKEILSGEKSYEVKKEKKDKKKEGQLEMKKIAGMFV